MLNAGKLRLSYVSDVTNVMGLKASICKSEAEQSRITPTRTDHVLLGLSPCGQAVPVVACTTWVRGITICHNTGIAVTELAEMSELPADRPPRGNGPPTLASLRHRANRTSIGESGAGEIVTRVSCPTFAGVKNSATSGF